MKYKAVIFDLDGVICHTDRYHYRAWKMIAEELQIPFDEAKNNLLRGISRMESLEILLGPATEQLSQAEKEKLAERKNILYREMLASMSPADLTEEVKETLHKLRQRGCLLAIGSSSKNAPFILERIGLGNYFDMVSDGNSITRSKPDPEVFLTAAKGLGLEAGECLVAEDARAGIDAACAGGFDSAGLGEAAAYDRTTYPLTSFQDIGRLVIDAADSGMQEGLI